ncbi:hypothetical protein C8T65DRAFT_693902 [Cerioporus squamosus]|nr:hypothetical protein C8T65DRAFT_693902 [Cerioporus squamosus]
MAAAARIAVENFMMLVVLGVVRGANERRGSGPNKISRRDCGRGVLQRQASERSKSTPCVRDKTVVPAVWWKERDGEMGATSRAAWLPAHANLVRNFTRSSGSYRRSAARICARAVFATEPCLVLSQPVADLKCFQPYPRSYNGGGTHRQGTVWTRIVEPLAIEDTSPMCPSAGKASQDTQVEEFRSQARDSLSANARMFRADECDLRWMHTQRRDLSWRLEHRQSRGASRAHTPRGGIVGHRAPCRWSSEVIAVDAMRPLSESRVFLMSPPVLWNAAPSISGHREASSSVEIKQIAGSVVLYGATYMGVMASSSGGNVCEPMRAP